VKILPLISLLILNLQVQSVLTLLIEAENALEYSWRKGKDWKERPILLRFATVEDLRPTQPKRSKKLWIKRNQVAYERELKTEEKMKLKRVAPLVVNAEEEERRKLRRTKFGYEEPSEERQEEQVILASSVAESNEGGLKEEEEEEEIEVE
jgi:hypothetical protein